MNTDFSVRRSRGSPRLHEHARSADQLVRPFSSVRIERRLPPTTNEVILERLRFSRSP